MTSRSPRLLLVDDEPSLRLTLAANLELEGFEVVEAGSGEEALRLLRGEAVDLVVTDIRMGGMNGLELFRRLKEQQPGLPVVMMTAFALEEVVAAALREGVFTVLFKPFDVGHAVRTLTSAARRPTVLVVDDLEAFSKATSEALELVGLRARWARSGEEAFEVLRQEEVDVCVLDLVMPGLSGPEVMERLRESHPEMAMIAVSGHSVPEMISQASSLEVFTYLLKPFEMGELVSSIAKARGHQLAWRRT